MNFKEKVIAVLMVEDDKICQYLTKIYLEGLNCKVDIAETALKAKKVINDSYDIVFLDIGLPDENGIVLAQEIRDELKLNIPIVAVTGHSLNESKLQYFKAGINDVIEKPATKQKLEEMLNSYVRFD